MEKEIARLQVIIREADNERKRQQKELDQVITERDILGTQLGMINRVNNNIILRVRTEKRNWPY
jgi:hypothetical protein